MTTSKGSSGSLGVLLLSFLQVLAVDCRVHQDGGASPEPASIPAVSGESPPLAISLVELQAVGEYRLIQAGPDRESQYVLFQRTVGQFRAGTIDQAAWQELTALLEGGELERLAPRYDLPPAEPGAPQVVYEDTHYRLTVQRGGETREVLAHEHAAPPLLQQIVRRLVALGRALPEEPRQGLFLVALDPAVADQIRWLRGKRAAASDDPALPRLAAVARTLARPGWLVPVPPDETREILQIFPGDARRRDLVHDGRQLAVCLLQGTENK